MCGFELSFLFRFYEAQQLRSFGSDVNVNLLKHVSKAHSSLSSQTHYVACRAINTRQKCISVIANNAIFISLPQEISTIPYVEYVIPTLIS